MSWMYMKKGIINDSEVGPLTDEALLQFATDGEITPKTLVYHPKNTGGNWIPMANIPLALQRYKEGEQSRATEREAKKQAADKLKAERQAERQAAKESRALIARENAQIAEERRQEERVARLIAQGELVEREQVAIQPSPFGYAAPVQQYPATPGYPQQPTTIVVNNVQSAPQPQHIQQTVVVQGGRGHQSQTLPALVNLLCLPGLGQLIQGRPFAAVFWWCLHIAAAASIAIGIGIFVWPIVWILCVLDAAMYRPR